MKFFIVAGEKSGDLHAGNLAKALKFQHPQLEILGWGGEYMEAAGVKILQNYEELAFMGFVEVLKNLSKIKGFMNLAKQQIEETNPDALVLVDYAGFNLRLAKWAKSKGKKVIYYIAPKAWAWNKSRAKKLQKYTDLVLGIFPFEVGFFKNYDVNIKYVGNPLFDEIRNYEPNPELIRQLKANGKPVVALLPGSRRQEIEAMMGIMAGLSEELSSFHWVLAGVSNFSDGFYKNFGGNFTLVKSATYDVLSAADAAVVTSGTATLETALFGVPEVVVYKTSAVTYTIAKALVEIKYISLVNLVADKPVVKELIQGEYSAENTKSELLKILNDKDYKLAQLENYKELREKLGTKEASSEAASEILNYIKK